MMLLLAAVLAAAFAPFSGTARAQDLPPARVRFLHAAPGAPNVDVYVDGARVAMDLAFGEATPHFTLDGQQHNVALRQSGTGPDSPALLEVPVPLVPSLAFTVVVQGSAGALEAALYEDILDEISPGMARLTAINAIADAPPLDVLTGEGGPLLQGVSYGAQFGTVNINTGVQSLLIVPAGGAVESALATLGDVPLRSGKLYTFVALGTLDGDVQPSALVLETAVNLPADGVRVQVGHGSPDAGAVDVYAGDTLIAPSLELGDLTGHLPLPAGDYTLALRAAGAPAADAPLLSQEVALSAANPAVTVVATGSAADGSLGLQVFDDAVGEVTPTTARVAVINAVPDTTATASVSDRAQTVLASDLAASAQAAPVDLAPADYMLSVGVTGEDSPVDLVVPQQSYYGGVYYTVLAYGGGGAPLDARVSATPIEVTPASVPVAAQAVAAVPTPTAIPAEAAPEVVEATPPLSSGEAAPAEAQPAVVEPSPTPIPVDGATELVQTTPTPAGEVVAQPAAPTPAPLVPQATAPTAYVDLNPGANLHCREYPSSTARSLGLIPTGTTLTVIGRPGEATLPDTGDPTPLPTPVIEAVADMWLAVRWQPAGGGEVSCWVNAQYLRVEWQGRVLDTLEELLELPEYPFNTAGEVVGADVKPPTPVFNAVIATVELEPGVSLQLRRLPDTTAESLALVPAGAQLEILGQAEAPSEGLVGQPTNPNWYYVRYRTENGGATIGWVSAQYLSGPTKLSRPVPQEEIPLVEVTEQGYFEQPGVAPVIPAEQQKVMGTVNVNPGANLNLRDRPTQDGRVVLGIPSGASMVINGRNADGSWVQVTYASTSGDLEGWVAAQYLLITRAGQAYDVMLLPDLSGGLPGEAPAENAPPADATATPSAG